jgi:hypothetical protein
VNRGSVMASSMVGTPRVSRMKETR